ncbi:MAG: type I methionyl aminopeptidase [Rhodoferax sp.]|nr:type I methionyl aminopeptidase [Actinomycetota bacterium]
MIGRDRIQYKTPDQVSAMRRAGLVVGETLALLRESAEVGMTTRDLDAIAEKRIRGAGAVPSFMGYHGFPATLCVSVNDEIVHGIPGDRVLTDGDVVSIDCGAIVAGWHGDAAVSLVVGHPDPADEQLVETTEEAMWHGIAALLAGRRLHEVGSAVEDLVESRAQDGGALGPSGYGIVEEYVGHGIGTEMHQHPQVPNYRVRDKGVRVRAGLVVAIEPMLTRGSAATRVLDDDWTVVSTDSSRAAHFEHTVAVAEDGLWVLTALDGGREQLARLGAPYAGRD